MTIEQLIREKSEKKAEPDKSDYRDINEESIQESLELLIERNNPMSDAAKKALDLL